jgi:hypothetical protein
MFPLRARVGGVAPAHVAYLTKTLKGYDAQRAAACAQHPQCRYDGGAAERLATTAADLSPRYDHRLSLVRRRRR